MLYLSKEQSFAKIEPLSGFKNCSIKANTVDLPTPLGPTMATVSPFLASKDIPFKTCLFS